MRLFGATMLMALVAAGCAASLPSVPQDPHQMTGSWGGWLIKPRSFEWINLEIREDGAFELTGEWGIQSSGVLVVRNGRVRFEGSRAWRGTLVLTDSAEGPVLKLERDDRTEQCTLHRWPRAG
jgi:hypothetical protein